MDTNEMSGEEIVTRLNQGSVVLDQMRKKVRNTLSIILAETDGTPDHEWWNKTWKFKSANVTFVVTRTYYIHSSSEFSVRFESPDEKYMGEFSSSFMKNVRVYQLSLHYTNVQVVHDGLSVFVEGMLSIVPELHDRLEPFINASNASDSLNS
jgi:hypothetical protein